VIVALTLLVAAGCVPAGLRWLRVAQREHYLGGRVSRFAVRWARSSPANTALAAVQVAGAIGALAFPPAALVTALAAVVAPLGLGVRGRTSPLHWTRRLRTTAAATAVLVATAVVLGLLAGVGPSVAAAAVALLPLLVDAALIVLGPVEARLSRRWSEQAAARLRAVDPVTVAITGSFGKTTTKVLATHLLAGSRRVVASPASFNNAAGLSRAVNEHLDDGVDVFVAEMGTYGPGEIRALCSWVRPDVAVLCNIGPVHLERFGSLDAIVAAKSEIFEGGATAVVNVDAHGLAALADRLEEAGRTLVRCSTSRPDATVVADRPDGGLRVRVGGNTLAAGVATESDPINVACALGIAVALGADLGPVAERLVSLPVAEHRRQVATAPSGVVVIDDTYNANPAGAAVALDRLARAGREGGRRAVVTPGMVELGPEQDRANEAFAAAAAQVADDVVIVGLTNRAALRRGAARGPATLHEVGVREEAVAWVRSNLAGGDAVLYENDLPDHFP